MKYTGKWWDNPHRTGQERYVASGVVNFLYGVIIGFIVLSFIV